MGIIWGAHPEGARVQRCAQSGAERHRDHAECCSHLSLTGGSMSHKVLALHCPPHQLFTLLIISSTELSSWHSRMGSQYGNYTVDDITDILRSQQDRDYSTTAVAALILYECMFVAPAAVKLFWRAPPNVVSVLFSVNWWAMLTWALVNLPITLLPLNTLPMHGLKYCRPSTGCPSAHSVGIILHN
ncbi:hypothetical protein OBBRIDRAFT_137935 [Obba rivulosa]|uniref:Uncharacterized protein n=1 Tax=Obba rivulosa TaxID=1052685 RepID=A0A8E2AN03_9APHY|nr:hypothetical protein OBBRIDRAFT_137935 [Obba rivulosa]